MVTGLPLLLIFLLAIALLLGTIIWGKVNPFLALLGAALFVALAVGIPLAQIPGMIAAGFAKTLGGIGIVIGLGMILGKLLTEAAATDKIANGLLSGVGEKRAPLAINLTGYLASIPVFIDAAFVIFMPLARRLSLRTGHPVITYVTALSVGLIATHAMVIPTPGPLAVADAMDINLGHFLLVALAASLPASLVGGWLYGLYLGRYTQGQGEVAEGHTDVATGAAAGGPSTTLAFGLLLFPIVLILAGSIISATVTDPAIRSVAGFLGDKNVALFLGILLAAVTLRRHLTRSTDELVSEAARDAGIILLITGAGGAFGYVIGASGIGEYLVGLMSAANISLLVLGFLLSAILRGSLGSATVALVTSAAILSPMVSSAGGNPVTVAAAICAGGMCLSLPNDSAFWVVSKFGGLSVTETLRSWTVGSTLAGVVAFVIVLIIDSL